MTATPSGNSSTRVLDKAYEVGFLGVVLPEKLGGIGGGIGALCVILENICQADASLGGIIFTNALAQEIMLCCQGRREPRKHDLPQGILGSVNFWWPSLALRTRPR